MHTMLAIALAAQVPAAAASAVSSTAQMYDFWCAQPGKDSTVLCMQRSLSQQMRDAKDDASKALIRKKLADLSKQSRAPTGASALPGSKSLLVKQFAEMKMGYCATKPANAKTLCSTAASRYPTGSSYTAFSGAVFDWYCAKPSSDSTLCKRAELLKKMKQPSLTPEQRKETSTSLKQYPAAAVATMQAIYADFCKVPANFAKYETPTCTNMRRTAQQQKMTKFYCEKPEHTESVWCKRNAILAKLNKLPPPPPGSPPAEERKSLLTELSALNKGKAVVSVNTEIIAAKKEYCAQAGLEAKNFCATSAISPRPPTIG